MVQRLNYRKGRNGKARPEAKYFLRTRKAISQYIKLLALYYNGFID